MTKREIDPFCAAAVQTDLSGRQKEHTQKNKSNKKKLALEKCDAVNS